MTYRLLIYRRAQKSMAGLQVAKRDRIENSRPPGCVKLKGNGDRRMRVGSYRVVYGIRDEERVAEILNVGHRRDVYRQG